MILAAIGFFGLATVLGLSVVVLGVRYHRGSPALVGVHVLAALLGLGLLFREILGGPVRMLYNDAALLFVLTLLGALVLLALRVSERGYRKPPPMVIVSLHAGLAIAGLVLLVKGYLRY